MIRGAVAAASLALCLGGVGMVTQGIAVPIEAEVGQRDLAQVFEQRLAAHGGTPKAQRQNASPTMPAGPSAQPASLSSMHRSAPSLPTTGPVARISVERLGVRQIVLAGAATHDQLALGPTVLRQGTAASPVTVLAAHRDTHFLFIRDLQAGDTITLQTVTGAVTRYRVTRLETVRWDAFALPLDPARPLLALTTCYPFSGTEYGGPWRRVAWAEQTG